ncbi:MAG: hypothetical protein RIS35_38 [Pseudomonadota bacterium]
MIPRFKDIAATPIADHAGAPLLQRAGSVACLTFNRPAEHNRLDPADIDALLPLLDRLAHQASTGAPGERPRALVLTGTGDRTFSSGYTLQAIISTLDSRFERMLDAIEELPLTTILAFNGGVYGGATDLALCCDIRIGVPGMRMFMPPAKFGLHYYPGGLRRYVSRLGLTAAKKILLTTMAIETEEMLRIGFLTDVVERSALAERVEAYLAHIEATEPDVVAQMKRHLHLLARRDENAPEAAALQASMTQAYEASLKSDALRERVARLLGGGKEGGREKREE